MITLWNVVTICIMWNQYPLNRVSGGGDVLSWGHIAFNVEVTPPLLYLFKPDENVFADAYYTLSKGPTSLNIITYEHRMNLFIQRTQTDTPESAGLWCYSNFREDCWYDL